MRPRIALFLLAFALLTGQAFADQITLKNGDRVTGQLIRADGKNLVIKSDLIGEVTVALANIDAITADKEVYVVLADGRTVHGTIATSGDSVEIRSSAGPVQVSRAQVQLIRSDVEQQAYLDTINPGWREQWTGGADLGIALTRGNSNTTNVALGLALTRETTNDKTSIYSASIYNRDSTGGISRTVASTLRFGARYDRNINKHWFGYGFTDLERNGLQDLNLRWVLGGGLGYHAIKTERTELDLLGGLAMNREYFKGPDNDRTSAEAQVGQTLSYRVNSRMTFKEALFVFPNLSDGGQYRINFDSTLVTDVTRRIGWHLTVSDRYLSNPPGGQKQNDLLLTTGIRLKLGKMQ
jgi:putative salt-induced outer membrane protein YdiY